jgi:hypothetical protein
MIMVIGLPPDPDLLNLIRLAEDERRDLPGRDLLPTAPAKNLSDPISNGQRHRTLEDQDAIEPSLKLPRGQGADLVKGATEKNPHIRRVGMVNPVHLMQQDIASNTVLSVMVMVHMAIPALVHSAVRHVALLQLIHAHMRDQLRQCRIDDPVELALDLHLPVISMFVLQPRQWVALLSLEVVLYRRWVPRGRLLVLLSHIHQSVPLLLTLECPLPFLAHLLLSHLLCLLRLVLFLNRRPLAALRLPKAVLLLLEVARSQSLRA